MKTGLERRKLRNNVNNSQLNKNVKYLQINQCGIRKNRSTLAALCGERYRWLYEEESSQTGPG